MCGHFHISKGFSKVTQRFYGSIKVVNHDRGVAFFTADHGIDCFVHFKDFIRAGLAEPKIGARYSFFVEENPKGPRASNIEGIA
jgi:cold shock CspA family protein